MSIAVLIKQLRDAGAPMEAIEIAVSAVEAERLRFETAEAARAAAEEARKADQRQRTARSRAKTAALSRDSNVTVTTKSRDPSPNEINLTPTHENSPSDPNGSSAPKGADQAEGQAPDAPSAVASAKRPRKVRKHLCPAGFAPKDRHYTAVETRGYSREFADREAIRMHRWSNSAGRPSCFKSDWDLTFDNWLEKAMDDLDSRPQRGAPPPSSTSPPSNGGFSFLNRSIRETYRNGQSDRAPEFDLQPSGGSAVVQLRRAYG